MTFLFSKFLRNLGLLHPSEFQLLIGTFECTPLLKETKNYPHIQCQHRTHVPLKSSFSLISRFSNVHEAWGTFTLLPCLLEIHSDSSLFPSDFLGGEKAGASFPIPWSYGEKRSY